MMQVFKKPEKLRVGWREWVALPDLMILAIKAKIDSGARTSALHTYFVEPFKKKGVFKVRFGIHPLQRRKDIEVVCEADIVDYREVSDSGGHREKRYVIETPVKLGETQWPIEVTLTNRDPMIFRMLLGRSAMKGKLLVNPGISYRTGRMLASKAVQLYTSDSKLRKEFR